MEDKEKKNEEERQRALKTLKASYEMYDNSREDTIKMRATMKDAQGNLIYSQDKTDDVLDLINTMQTDIKQKYIELGGDVDDLYAPKKTKKKERSELLRAISKAEYEDGMKSYISEANSKYDEKEEPVKPVERKKVSERLYDTVTTEKNESPMIADELMPKKPKAPQASVNSYDIVKLPSKGECYKHKMKEVEVESLTAYDENIILSPGLYKSGTFLDHLIKDKIHDINPDSLIQGDRDAIIIWLRADGYGNEYPITVTDPKTGKKFDTVADLSKLSYKKFKLKGDENGYFNFKLPNSGDEIKFKFLTIADVKKLNRIKEEEEDIIRLTEIKKCTSKIKELIDDVEDIKDNDNEEISEALNVLDEKIMKEFDNVNDEYYTHDLTNRLILSTISINGNTDKEYIANYILHMNIRDSIAYRTYIVDNEPGVDYNIKVKRPDSLGGGYVDTFLQLDQFIFIAGI